MRIKTLAVLLIGLILPSIGAGRSATPTTEGPTHRASVVRVTVLSTMLAGDPRFKGIGEWGYSALVEVDGRRLLLDTGARAETVLQNARELGLDLAGVTDVVLTHNHWDHVGGLLTLRREFSKRNPAALSRVHVGRGIFWPRPGADGKDDNGLLPLKAEFEATGGVFVEHADPAELMPGVWITGPIPRPHPERNYDPAGRVRTPSGVVEDDLPEDTALVIDTQEGLIVLSGCGHAGIINTIEYARKVVRPAPVHAAIGGLHLFRADEAQLAWTAARLKEFGLAHLLAAHCTGMEATFRLRELTGLTRQTAVVGAVGSSFTLGKGIDPLQLAR
jgi:7,8-dihydropterin-6-yl-methyl-4-(beta-D-ribofuranosyl)aminobenzene 5'-phosphate synthase